VNTTTREDAARWKNQHPALSREIMRCEVGSTSHGVSLAGTDDFDMMAIGIPRPEYVLGLEIFDTAVVRTAEIREGKKSVPSQPGDLDLVIHSLQKFCNLAGRKGNPSALLMLYAPMLAYDALGQELRAHRHLFTSKQVGKAFLGYMIAQKQRLKGERGQMRTTRSALIEQYGFDTKYAMHVLRLGYQGMRFMDTGMIECPIAPPMRNFLLGVRQGQQSFEGVIALAEQYEMDIERSLKTADMPDECEIGAINRMLERMHLEAWGYYATS
jgi:predicted nucleotidyltransferase